MSSDWTVSWTAIAAMILVGLFTVALPLGLGLWFKERTRGRWRFFFLGCGIYLLFALVLEQGAHKMVLGSPLGESIMGNLWWYALYSGLMAGLFEECGRWLAFRLTWRRLKGPGDALMYGVGHGGFEAVSLAGILMVNNVLVALALNRGGLPAAEELMGPLSETGMAALAGLASTPAWGYLWTAFERGAAICLHVSLSVLVYTAVTRRGAWYWLPAAIGIHALADLITVAASAYLPVAGTELLAAAAAAGAALIARKLYLREMAEKP